MSNYGLRVKYHADIDGERNELIATLMEMFPYPYSYWEQRSTPQLWAILLKKQKKDRGE